MSLFFETIIIGGGASGLLCASKAASQGKSVCVLEHKNKFARKIIISGGGRCNFTNLNCLPSDYVSNNPHFCKSALSLYPSDRFIELVKKHKIAYHEKKLGQLFCDNKSIEILNLLLSECRKNNVELKTDCNVHTLGKNDSGYFIQSSSGDFHCKNLVIATGGLSMPPTGASDFAYQVAKQFKLKLIKTEPALVPLLFKKVSELSGISLPVEISNSKYKYCDDLLFTHKGFSGPAILKMSLNWTPGQTLKINFLPDNDLKKELLSLREQKSKMSVNRYLENLLPQRMSKFWLNQIIKNRTQDMSNLSNKTIDQIHQSLHQWTFIPEGTEGYKKAEVTRGGVCTSELSSKTMECKNHPQLYFIGEAIDVTGLLGGYNFQWAWASAIAASEHLM